MINDSITYNGFNIKTYSFAIDASDNYYAAFDITKKVGADIVDEGLHYLRVDGVNCAYSSESEASKEAFNAAVQIIDKRNE